MRINKISLSKYKRTPFIPEEGLEVDLTENVAVLSGVNGAGKAQTLTSRVKVPGGWTQMGHLKVGDMVVAKDGTSTKVTGVHPQPRQQIYKVGFGDGRSTRVTGDHLWGVYRSPGDKRSSYVMTTLEIREWLSKNLGKFNTPFVWVDLIDPEPVEQKELPMDPYLLGVVLGDGSLRDSSVTITNPDEFIQEEIKRLVPKGSTVTKMKLKDIEKCPTYYIAADRELGMGNTTVTTLKELGLMGTLSWTKFIPDDYIHSSVQQRLDLIQGLFDTDGDTGVNGTMSFTTTSYKMALQIVYILRSLGAIAKMTPRITKYTHNGVRKPGRESYRISVRYKKPWDLFRLPRKRDRVDYKGQYLDNLRLRIETIEEDGFEEAQCITIDHSDKLYVTDDFIVTHNSSLMEELSPLPSDRNHFERGGYKEVIIEHSKQEFILRSDFSNVTPSYSFIVDGEELNSAGLVTMQRDLAQQYFSIDSSIHDILIGKENFTDMSLLARKKLFSSITHLNIDAVLDGYNKLREEEKTSNLLLKTQSANYKNEESKLIPKGEIETKKKDLEETKALVDKLLQMRTDLSQYRVTGIGPERYRELSNLINVSKKFVKDNFPLVTSYPNKDIPNIRVNVDRELSLLSYQLEELYKQLEKKRKELESASKTNNLSMVELKKYEEEIIPYISNRLESLTLIKDIEKVTEQSYSDLYRLETGLPDVVGQMLPNRGLDGERVYTNEIYTNLLTAKGKVQDQLHHLNALELSIRNDKERVGSLKGDIICPSCEHSWGAREAFEKCIHQSNDMGSILKQKESLSKKLKELDRHEKELTEYFSHYKNYSLFRKATEDSLKFFWDKVDEEDYLLHDPNKIASLLYLLNREMTSIKEVNEAKEKLARVKESMNNLMLSETMSIDKVKEEIYELDSKCSMLQQRRVDLNRELSLMDRLNSSYSKLETVSTEIEKGREDLKDLHRTHLVDSIIEVVDEYLREYRLKQVQLETELKQVDTIQYTLDLYQKDIDKTKEELKVLKAMLTELCPKTGLIAKSVSSFLNTIIHNVNNTLDKIWNYKMVLKPIDVGTDALNYRFRVEVEDKLTIGDISTVSKGMKEAINLSFRLVLYKLLKLDNYPLYLDELGSNLSPENYTNVINLVIGLSNTDRFSQVFIITHKDNLDYLRNKQEVLLG